MPLCLRVAQLAIRSTQGGGGEGGGGGGGGGDGGNGGGLGGDGGGDGDGGGGGGCSVRAPQSVQSVPSAQIWVVLPEPPSSHCPFTK